MYICDMCGTTFSDPDVNGCCSERLGYEIEYLCPCCGSNAVEETVKCDACENACEEEKIRYIEVTNKYDETLQGFICNDCLYEALEEFLGEEL